jgi:TolB-like protein
MLLERPGEVVTREEIQKRLWPADTFVDFDRGLNRATNRPRESLGDDADSPRFIETLPRRGYRSIAPVDKLHESGRVAEPMSRPGDIVPTSRSQRWPGFNRAGPRMGWAIAILGIALLTFGGWFTFFRPWDRAVESVAVLPFSNGSPDSSAEYLSDGITESLINNLSQLPNLRVMARSTVFRYKGKDTDPQKIGNELHVEAVLSGRLLQQGNMLIIQTELKQARSSGVASSTAMRTTFLLSKTSFPRRSQRSCG